MKILALDLGSRTGFAHSLGFGGTWDCSVRRDESGGMRLVRFRCKLNEIEAAVPIELVVFEAARHARPRMQGALVVTAELQGVLKLWCEERGILYRGVSPSEVKRFATGKGNASKDMMASAGRRCGWNGDEHEMDARWILAFASHLYDGA